MIERVLGIDIGVATERTQMVLVKQEPNGLLVFQVGKVVQVKNVLDNISKIFEMFDDYGVPDTIVMEDWFSMRELSGYLQARIRQLKKSDRQPTIAHVRLSADMRKQYFDQLKHQMLKNRILLAEDMPPVAQVMSPCLLALSYFDRKGVRVFNDPRPEWHSTFELVVKGINPLALDQTIQSLGGYVFKKGEAYFELEPGMFLVRAKKGKSLDYLEFAIRKQGYAEIVVKREVENATTEL